ncbi:class I SAM-dependent methyltransferase [Kitasatospora acidiphila]|uniref:Class I SAM-dependent methyltransferase n=1 Tax=Kitasatospora acidiphila TaxID=2567942 RepID=A0A540VZY9_9ACTN|nr:class I SAM-dependent methyltransferase [Kitasatospora acidiphila]TQF02336.1 class I SAM-dependent methyltransferase [Kitasatospora acidiphila]
MTEPDFLRNTRASYDAIAADYTERFRYQPDIKPLDRAMLAAFAELVRDGGHGPVADLGCGPGRLTPLLRELGLEDPFGLDLSPQMIEIARKNHPDLRFEVGSITALDLPDNSVGGILSWYSIIHLPPDQLPRALAEFHRVLAPGGALLVAFQVGDQLHRRDELLGHQVLLEFHRRTPETVIAALAAAGLPVHTHLVRGPVTDGVESVPQAFLLARKPSTPA